MTSGWRTATSASKSPWREASKKGLDYLALTIEVDVGRRRFGLDPRAGAAGGLPRRHRRAVEQGGDLLEGDREHVVQDEGDPLLRAERLEHAEHRQADRVGDKGLVLGVAALDRANDRVGYVRAERLLPASLAGAQHVEADPCDHRRQPARQVLDLLRVAAGQTQPGLLHRLVGFAAGAEHAEGHRPEAPAALLEPHRQILLSGLGHISALGSVHLLDEEKRPAKRLASD